MPDETGFVATQDREAAHVGFGRAELERQAQRQGAQRLGVRVVVAELDQPGLDFVEEFSLTFGLLALCLFGGLSGLALGAPFERPQPPGCRVAVAQRVAGMIEDQGWAAVRLGRRARPICCR